MSSEISTPRIQQPQLQDNISKMVRIVGRVVKNDDGASIVIDDGAGQTVVTITPETSVSDQFVEVVGTVNDDLSVQEMKLTNFGNDFDLDTYGKMVALSQKYTELF